MKKKWYRSRTAKGIWIVICIVSAVTAAVCSMMVVGLRSGGIRLKEKGNFVDSISFVEEIYMESYDLVHALEYESLISNRGSSDVIDLGALSLGDSQIYSDTTGLVYQLSDLVEWASQGYETTDSILVCTKPDGTEYYMYSDDFVKKLDKGELSFVFQDENNSGTDSLEEADTEMTEADSGADSAGSEDRTKAIRGGLLDWWYTADGGIQNAGVLCVKDKSGKIVYENVRNYDGTGIRELYKPVGAESILDVVNAKEKREWGIEEAFNALTEGLDEISSALGGAYSLQNRFGQGNTNLNYLYVDQDAGLAWTNAADMGEDNTPNVDSEDTRREAAELSSGIQQSQSATSGIAGYEATVVPADSLEYEKMINTVLEGNYSYMILRPMLKNCSTNLPTDDQYSLNVWQSMLTSTLTNSGRSSTENYVFAVWTDYDFSIYDALAQKKQQYDTYSGWMIPMLAGAAVSGVLLLTGLGWLTAAAGRKPSDEEIHLNFFDRWYTEVAAGLVILVWGGGMITGFSGFAAYDTWPAYRIFAAFTGLWTILWFLPGWLSLVRRIKARTLWKNSLLRALLKGLGRLLGGCKKAGALFAENTASRVKMTLIFGGFCFFQFFVTGIMVGNDQYVFLAVLMAADIAGLIYLLKKAQGREEILKGLEKITGGELQYKIPAEKLTGEQKKAAEQINHIGEGLDAAVEASLKNERMKTELITNVSHDIKTPLTSIINYVDLLKRENFTDPKVCGYLDILEEKSRQLKNLTEDVVEASRASTGNISLEMTNLNFVELVQQIIGEFEERFEEKHLILVVHFDEEETMICADGRRLWRVLENIFTNVTKYAMENTRVYAEIRVQQQKADFSLKNISARPLNISADELTERFVWGDVARSTEGSGLGLSIAQSLTELMGGEFKLYVDGDLFKVTVSFLIKNRE